MASSDVQKYDYYRPQRSWGRVIFSKACVKNSVHSRGCLGPDPGGRLGGSGLGGGCLGPDPRWRLGGLGPDPGVGWGSGWGCPGPHWGGVSRPRPGGRLGSGQGGVQAHTWGCIPACTEVDTPPADGYCCGRYASYWNAFLFRI